MHSGLKQICQLNEFGAFVLERNALKNSPYPSCELKGYFVVLKHTIAITKVINEITNVETVAIARKDSFSFRQKISALPLASRLLHILISSTGVQVCNQLREGRNEQSSH